MCCGVELIGSFQVWTYSVLHWASPVAYRHAPLVCCSTSTSAQWQFSTVGLGRQTWTVKCQSCSLRCPRASLTDSSHFIKSSSRLSNLSMWAYRTALDTTSIFLSNSVCHARLSAALQFCFSLFQVSRSEFCSWVTNRLPGSDSTGWIHWGGVCGVSSMMTCSLGSETSDACFSHSSETGSAHYASNSPS